MPELPEPPSSHGFPGRLFVFEGLDGSGKSTQAALLGKWLQSNGYRVFFTEWNSSELVASTIRRGKKKGLLTPTTFSLLHAVDFADRFERKILPPLRAGYLVVCDRYSYTAFVRDAARGCDPAWVRMIYSFAPRPDRIFYFRVPVGVTLKRKLASRQKMNYYEAGMDLGLSDDLVESYQRFQGRLKREYDRLATIDDFRVVDAQRPVEVIQAELRADLKPLLAKFPTQTRLMHDG
ncbi:MAG TPA: dTMP kinase [Thermoplasmata archaeon]|jgi:dTMP kinase|nr:dTMP kinase [Thermoplasmata archaeon]